MNMNRKSNRALSSLHTIAAAQSPVVRDLLDGVIRRAARGERDAVNQLAREFHPQMVAHAEEHMARFDMDVGEKEAEGGIGEQAMRSGGTSGVEVRREKAVVEGVAPQGARQGEREAWRPVAISLPSHGSVVNGTRGPSWYTPLEYGAPQRRDPVDAGRQLEAAAQLFREGRMPEHGVDILEGVAAGCTYKQIAADLGITERAVEGRMGTMLDAYRKRIARLGLLPTMVCLRVVASTPGAIDVLRKAA